MGKLQEKWSLEAARDLRLMHKRVTLTEKERDLIHKCFLAMARVTGHQDDVMEFLRKATVNKPEWGEMELANFVYVITEVYPEVDEARVHPAPVVTTPTTHMSYLADSIEDDARDADYHGADFHDTPF